MPKPPFKPSEKAVELVKELFKNSPKLAGLSTDDELIEFVAAQVDVAAELVMDARSGKISVKSLATALAKKNVAIAKLLDNEAVQCGAALASLGFSISGGATTCAATLGVGCFVGGATGGTGSASVDQAH